MIPQYLTASELSERLRVSEDWLYTRAARGEIPSVMFGGLRRFPEPEIEAWLKERGGELAEVKQLRSVS